MQLNKKFCNNVVEIGHELMYDTENLQHRPDSVWVTQAHRNYDYNSLGRGGGG